MLPRLVKPFSKMTNDFHECYKVHDKGEISPHRSISRIRGCMNTPTGCGTGAILGMILDPEIVWALIALRC